MAADALHVLMLGKDATLLRDGPAVASDTQSRHRVYARALRARCGAASSIQVLTFAPRGMAAGPQDLGDGLVVHPTRSAHRATYLADVAMRLPGVLRGRRPDVVTVQTPWEEAWAGWVVARLTGAAFVPQLHFDLFSPAWLRESPLNPWRHAVASFMMRRADRVRVVSAAQRDQLVARLGLAPGRIDVVPVGVDFHPASGPSDAHKAALVPEWADKAVVLFVGRFHAAKDLPLWVEVAGRVAARHPAARFVLAGDGPERHAIEALVEARGLADRVRFLGAVGHERLPAVYAAADVFLLSSAHEGFGRVIVEAGLAGLPVVATACGGPEGLVVEGETGFLRPRGDAAGLAEAVSELVADPARARALGAAGQARMRAEFGLEALVERLVSCWAKARDQVAPRARP